MAAETLLRRNAEANQYQQDQRELLDIRAVARLLGCSKRHIERMSQDGRMPSPKKLGVLVRFSRTELLAWIADGCKPIAPKGGPPNEKRPAATGREGERSNGTLPEGREA